MWRLATPRDDDTIVELCLQLYREDPGPLPAGGRRTRETLATLRREPWRGRAAVLDVDRRVVGYALLVSYWSNELGGEVCAIDELYVGSALRGRGHGAALFEAIGRGELWPGVAAALAVGVTAGNTGARRLYERLGFTTIGHSLVRQFHRQG